MYSSDVRTIKDAIVRERGFTHVRVLKSPHTLVEINPTPLSETHYPIRTRNVWSGKLR